MKKTKLFGSRLIDKVKIPRTPNIIMLGKNDDINEAIIEEGDLLDANSIKMAISTIPNAPIDFNVQEITDEDIDKIVQLDSENESILVTISAAQYASCCFPYNVIKPKDVIVYYITDYDTTEMSVTLKQLEGNVIPGNVGFIMYSNVTTATQYKFNRAYIKPENISGNILYCTLVSIKNEDLNFDKYDYFLMGKKSKGIGMYILDESSYIPANRSYMMLPKGTVTSEQFFKFNIK